MPAALIDRDALLTEAMSLHRAGDLDHAERDYRRLLSIDPKHYGVLTLLGTLHLQRGEQAEGIKLLERSLTINPRQPNAYNSRANALRDMQRYHEALANYDAALALDPGFPEAWYNRGITLMELAWPAEARASYDRAIALNPAYARAYNNRGNLFGDWKQYDKALLDYDKALSLGLKDAVIYTNRAAVLAALKRYDEALTNCAEALELSPTDAMIYATQGQILAATKRYDEALASCEKAIELDPLSAEAYVSLSSLLWTLGRFQDALATCDRAIARLPDNGEARYGKGYIKIMLGQWQEGWELYENRPSADERNGYTRSFGRPKWSGGENIDGKAILLHVDQGLGDTIQFCRYVPMVEALGAKAIVEVPATLHGLVSTVSATASVVVKGDPLPSFDFHSPFTSLPLAFRTTTATIPAKTPYLAPEPHKQQEWRARLGFRSRPRVGIVWSSSGQLAKRSKARKIATVLDSQRDIPFALFQQIITPGIEYFVLQKDVSLDDEHALSARHEITIYKNAFDNFSDTAALTSEMDLIISVDTAVAHLAGALGKPVWILFPHSHQNLLAIVGREESPWYPTARLFRQPQPGDWESVISRVVEELAGGLS